MNATVCTQLIVNGTAILSQAGLALMMSAARLRLIRHIKGATVPEGAGQREIWICLHAYTSSFVSITSPCLGAPPPNNSGLISSLTEVSAARLILVLSEVDI